MREIKVYEVEGETWSDLRIELEYGGDVRIVQDQGYGNSSELRLDRRHQVELFHLLAPRVSDLTAALLLLDGVKKR